ncbi:MAG: hypothetical protein KDC57_03120 [Saprospiraceae bacterium]|nr:hypothetical protein [Saprospiraceae bacterium]
MLAIITRFGLWLLLFAGMNQVVWAGEQWADDPVDPSVASSAFDLTDRQDLLDYLQHWSSRKARYRDQVAFLRAFFYRTHRKYLKQYVPYSSFEQTLERGNYDCVSGTALFATLLTELQIPFEIRETGYHVFLIAHVQDQFVLLESTDPNSGFMEDQQAIIHQVQQYIFDGLDAAMVSKPIHNSISLTQLEGLMHYNLALVYFQQRDRATAALHLDHALARYDSPRIHAMYDLLKEHPEQVMIAEQ